MKRRVVMVSLDKDLLDAIIGDERFDVVGVFDAGSASAFGVPSLGPDTNWNGWSATNPTTGVILAVDVPGVRRALAAIYGFDNATTVVAEGAYVSPHAQIGHACIVQRGAVVSAGVSLGEAVKINIQVAIHHDSQIGAYSTIAPGARLLGSVNVGEEVYIGASATVLPHRRIGARAMIGAGAVVTTDVAEGETVMGVPARVHV